MPRRMPWSTAVLQVLCPMVLSPVEAFHKVRRHLLFPFCPSVLKPCFDLCVGKAEVIRQANSFGDCQVFLAAELLFQSFQLNTCKGGAPSAVFVVFGVIFATHGRASCVRELFSSQNRTQALISFLSFTNPCDFLFCDYKERGK